MKNTFPGYYRPTDEEFTSLWNRCIFILDANVLLNFYRYSPDTSTELLGILSQVSERLWLPHQAALEYQKNRLNVISTQKKAYSELITGLNETFHQITAKLNVYRKHPFINVDSLYKQIADTFSDITARLEEQNQTHPELLDFDEVHDRISNLFEGKVGQSYSFDKLQEIYKSGKIRYDKNIPPGYKDVKNKDEDNKYGDLVLWIQIIDKAKTEKLPIILVTDDTKEDWWWKFQGKTIGARPELIEELKLEAGVSFYMYQSDQFMVHAQHFLKRQVDQDAIDEVREVRKQREEILSETMETVQELGYIRANIDNLTLENADLKAKMDQIKSELTQIDEKDGFNLSNEESLKLMERRHWLQEDGKNLGNRFRRNRERLVQLHQHQQLINDKLVNLSTQTTDSLKKLIDDALSL